MDGDNKFWLGFWMIIALVLISLIAGISYTTIHRDNQITEMVKSGADPIRARCSIVSFNDMSSHELSLCSSLPQVMIVQPKQQ